MKHLSVKILSVFLTLFITTQGVVFGSTRQAITLRALSWDERTGTIVVDDSIMMVGPERIPATEILDNGESRFSLNSVGVQLVLRVLSAMMKQGYNVKTARALLQRQDIRIPSTLTGEIVDSKTMLRVLTRDSMTPSDIGRNVATVAHVISFNEAVAAVKDLLTRDNSRFILDCISQALDGRLVKARDVKVEEIWFVKEGGVASVVRLEMKIRGVDEPVVLVLNMAKDLTYAAARLTNEYGILTKWSARYPEHIVKPYGLGYGITEGLRVPVVVGKWLEGYHEVHIVGKSDDTRIQIWQRERHGDKVEVKNIILSKESSTAIFKEMARLHTLYADFHGNGKATLGILALNDGPFTIKLSPDGSFRLMICSVIGEAEVSEGCVPLALAFYWAANDSDDNGDVGTTMYWNDQKSAFEAFTQGMVDQGTHGLGPEARLAAEEHARVRANEILASASGLIGDGTLETVARNVHMMIAAYVVLPKRLDIIRNTSNALSAFSI